MAKFLNLRIKLEGSTQNERIAMIKALKFEGQVISRNTAATDLNYNWKYFTNVYGESWCGDDSSNRSDFTIISMKDFLKTYGKNHIDLSDIYNNPEEG